ncbi:alpha/beta-hydrolase [Thozetella sp. PMI_491]|nr:alpha/beta-hydrolase [Thozetella sp. PMI_491]
MFSHAALAVLVALAANVLLIFRQELWPVSTAPTVKTALGTVIGSTNNSIDTFNGVPFAEPPVGTLRLRPPQRLSKNFGTLNATGISTACMQLSVATDAHSISLVPTADLPALEPFLRGPAVTGEDCLTLDIQRPSFTRPGSKLPVLFWIYGGGFISGSTAQYDWSNFIHESVKLGHPIMVVKANYRLSTLGFLGGKELQADGATNLGLKDQRLALEWVADNIEAFGGDPHKVTIFGESAGSFSVLYQSVVNDGDNTYRGKPLFRGGIGDSGALVPAEPVDGKVAQDLFDTIVESAGCSSSPKKLECLRALPYEAFVNASSVAPALLSTTGVQMPFVPRPDSMDHFYRISAEKAIRAGHVARVPVINGNQADEGTILALDLYNGTTKEKLVDLLTVTWPGTRREILEHFVSLYPDTGPSPGDLYPGFRYNAQIFGDLEFFFQRRYYLELISPLVPAWSYIATYDSSVPYLGTYHLTDILLYESGQPSVPYHQILRHYISFVNFQDPNAIPTGSGSLRVWPNWRKKDRALIEFEADGQGIIFDDFREKAYEYFRQVVSDIKM